MEINQIRVIIAGICDQLLDIVNLLQGAAKEPFSPLQYYSADPTYARSNARNNSRRSNNNKAHRKYRR